MTYATLRGSDFRKDIAPQPLPSTTTRGLPVPRLFSLWYIGASSIFAGRALSTF